MLRFLMLAALALASPAAAQTVSGCGTTAIPKASLASAPKLTIEATCFGKARDTAAGAIAVRQAQIARLTPPPAPASAVPGPIGMNLAEPSYFDEQFPFLDRMKNASAWKATIWGGDTGEKLEVNEHGWPKSIPPKANGVSAGVALDPIELGHNRYVVTWDGTGNMRGSGEIKIVSFEPHRMVFDLVAPLTYLQFTAENFTAADPMRNIVFVRADQEALLKAGQTFSPDFLERTKAFSPIRFMEWGFTNGNQLVSWSQRLTPASYSWTLNNVPNSTYSVPVEIMVQLANEAHVEPWFCIPAHADDNYVIQFTTYVRDHLDPSLSAHFEYSNEVWNGSFEQAKWAQTMANKLWGQTMGVDANNDGKIDPNDPKEGVPAGNNIYYGYRAAQVAQIELAVMGDRPINTVLGAFLTWYPPSEYIIKGVQMVGDPAKLFRKYATAPYFGRVMSGSYATDRATVLGWANGGQAGIDAAFDALFNGDPKLIDNGDAFPALAAQYVQHAALAKKYGLDLVAYEGGFGTVAYPFSDADKPTMIDFYTRMKASPRMADAVRKWQSDFTAAGGKTMVWFRNFGTDSTHGAWGAQKNPYTPSVIFETLKTINAQP